MPLPDFTELSNESLTAILSLLDSSDGSFQNISLKDIFGSISDEFQADEHWLSSDKEIAVIILFSMLALIGLFENSLVFYVISRKGWKQSSRNWYILNLAGSDILTCLMGIPLTTVRVVLKNWTLGSYLCKAVSTLQTFYVFVSTFTIVALAIDRYSSIIYNNDRVSFKCRACACLCLIWIVSFAIASPTWMTHDIEHVRSYNNDIMYSLCFEKWPSNDSYMTYTAIVFLLQYMSPLIAIIILHFLIGRFLNTRLEARVAESSAIRRKRRRHRKNILLLSCMAIGFGITWFPLSLINALVPIDFSIFQGLDFPFLHSICILLTYSSVCLNPLIYGLLNTNFKRDLLKMCGGNFQPRFSVYTDFTRRESQVPETLGLISTTPIEMGTSNNNLSRVQNGATVSAL